MDRKYRIIFLLILLCLVCLKKSYSQNCIWIKYDGNGNRISQYVLECGSEYKYDETKVVAIDKGMSVDEKREMVSVYPNPNNGVFCVIVDIDNDNDNAVDVMIYNSNGVLMKKDNLSDSKMIDISDKPSGIYLLRIIKGECVFNEIVVKL